MPAAIRKKNRDSDCFQQVVFKNTRARTSCNINSRSFCGESVFPSPPRDFVNP